MQADGSVFNAALRELKISFWGCLATVSRPLHSCRKYTEESTKLHEKCRTQLLFLLPFTLPAPSFTIFSGCNLPSTSYRSESVTLCNLPATCMQCRQGIEYRNHSREKGPKCREKNIHGGKRRRFETIFFFLCPARVCASPQKSGSIGSIACAQEK